MRVGLVSDLHGNAVALEAVARDVERAGVDRVVCLGDLVQGGAEPRRCLALVERLGWPVVLGNADAFVLDPATAEEGTEPVTEAQLELQRWSLAQLSDAERERVARFPLTIEVALHGDRTLLCCHAVPSSYHPFLLPSTDEATFRALLDGVTADVVAGGHMHLQFVRRRGDTLFVNPGSAGLSYDHEQPEDGFRVDPWGAWGIVDAEDDGSLRVQFRRVPLPVDEVVRAILVSGMPQADAIAGRWAPRPAG